MCPQADRIAADAAANRRRRRARSRPALSPNPRKPNPKQQPAVKLVPTKPIDGQKTGTSGLRKRTKVFTSDNYLANWVQSLFTALGGPDALKGKTLALGGDGRYFGREAAQIIIKLAAGNGFERVVVGRGAIMATPAMSALIRRRSLYGGLLMTASHNPGGPDADFGIKFNWSAGEPAPEKVTDKIYEETMRIKELRTVDIPDVDLDKVRRLVQERDGFFFSRKEKKTPPRRALTPAPQKNLRPNPKTTPKNKNRTASPTTAASASRSSTPSRTTSPP